MWACKHCNIDMVSITSGVTWCPNCGKIASIHAPEMMPAISFMIFEAKRSAGQKVPESNIKITYELPTEKSNLKIVN